MFVLQTLKFSIFYSSNKQASIDGVNNSLSSFLNLANDLR
jgi:hypothetical protein